MNQLLLNVNLDLVKVNTICFALFIQYFCQYFRMSRLSINFFLSYEFQLVTLQSDVDVSKMLVIMLQQVVEIGMVGLITIIAMWPMMTPAW